MEQLRRTWAEIDLDKIKHNYAVIREKCAEDVAIMSVVKANAYGHGAAKVAQVLEGCGSDWFAVSNLNEGIELRRAGITKPVLILGWTPPEQAQSLAENRMAQTLISTQYAQELAAYAVEAGVTVDVHVGFDTGMSRIGFSCRDIVEAADEIYDVSRLKGINIEGAFTHFAVSDIIGEENTRFTHKQAAMFSRVVSALEQRGVKFKYKHCCNSGGVLFYPEYHFNMVRPGIVLYGFSPTAEPVEGADLRPAMELKTVVSHLKTVCKGESIGYGRAYFAKEDITVATVPMGYADGYFRALSNIGVMWVGGELAQIVGRICMDQLMLDVTGLNVKIGDEVTVFGGDSPITADNVGGLAHTNSYEWLCAVSRRVPRVYLKDGRVDEVTEYLL